MKIYYINPKTRDLIVYDPDEKELFIMERVPNVRVMIGDQVQIGDFEPSTESGGTQDHDHTKVRQADRERKKKKERLCGGCGETGHRKDTCPRTAAAV